MTLFPDEPVIAPSDGVDLTEPDEYDTKGRTIIAARWGEIYISSNRSLPPITEEGVRMTRDEADAVLKERHGQDIVYEKKGKE